LEGKGKSSSGTGGQGRIGIGAGAAVIGTPRSGSAAGRGRMIGQVNELWGQVEEIRRSKKGRNAESGEGWLGDERALAEVADVSGAWIPTSPNPNPNPNPIPDPNP
jgi:hypothetical protein